MKNKTKIIVKHLNNYKIYQTGMKNIQLSLDQVAINKNNVRLKEQLSIYKAIVNSIDEALKILPDDEREFIKLRYINENTMQETARQMGCSVQSCFRIRNSAMNKLLISLSNLINISPDLGE